MINTAYLIRLRELAATHFPANVTTRAALNSWSDDTLHVSVAVTLNFHDVANVWVDVSGSVPTPESVVEKLLADRDKRRADAIEKLRAMGVTP